MVEFARVLCACSPLCLCVSVVIGRCSGVICHLQGVICHVAGVICHLQGVIHGKNDVIGRSESVNFVHARQGWREHVARDANSGIEPPLNVFRTRVGALGRQFVAV